VVVRARAVLSAEPRACETVARAIRHRGVRRKLTNKRRIMFPSAACGIRKVWVPLACPSRKVLPVDNLLARRVPRQLRELRGTTDFSARVQPRARRRPGRAPRTANLRSRRSSEASAASRALSASSARSSSSCTTTSTHRRDTRAQLPHRQRSAHQRAPRACAATTRRATDSAASRTPASFSRRSAFSAASLEFSAAMSSRLEHTHTHQQGYRVKSKHDPHARATPGSAAPTCPRRTVPRSRRRAVNPHPHPHRRRRGSRSGGDASPRNLNIKRASPRS
jgi:hypothetical protein